MDLLIANPPAKREEAMAVANELYRYCPDIVDQGTGTLSALAADMVMGRWWNLWWD